MQGQKHTYGLIAAVVAAFLVFAPGLRAATKTWTGSGQNWNTANWTPSAPVAGDDVIINGNIVLTNTPVVLASYTLNSGNWHTFAGTATVLRATNVVIDGTVTHSNVTTKAVNGSGHWVPDHQVNILADSNITLSSSGKIDVKGRGYPNSSGENTGPSGFDGYGPGAGQQYYGGGGHGGRGGGTTVGGNTNGSLTVPSQAGSSGGGHSAGREGGAGGGVVRLEAVGKVIVDGTVQADGDDGHSAYGSGGAGGSVYVKAAVVAGAGLLSADGGAKGTTFGGGGGGGRIAVLYTNAAAQQAEPIAPRFATRGRTGISSTYVPHNGEYGTVYLPGQDILPADAMHGGFHLVIPGLTNWTPNSVTISNGAVMLEGVDIDVATDLTLDSGGGLDLRDDSSISCVDALISTGAELVLKNHSVLSSSGDVVVTNGGVLSVYAGATNGMTGAYGARINVTGDFVIATSSYVYPHSEPTNGGVVRFEVGNLTIHAGGAIDADGKGFPRSLGENTGPSGFDGYGPGAGGQYYGGGGYGGRGGEGQAGTAGQTYGSSNAPVQPGSSGGGHTSGNRGGAGGGAVIVSTAPLGVVTVDGTISADGDKGQSSYGAGGSGGAIYLDCGTFQGSGVLSAIGGNGGTSYQPSGGGGGRIAVWRIFDNWSGSSLSTNVATARGSAVGGGNDGFDGTVFLGQNETVDKVGTLILIQ